MNYCVVKNTTVVIDGSDNSSEIMILNALNAGYAESDVEILTKEDYAARKEAEPKPIPEPTLEQRNRADIDYIGMMTGVL